MDHKPTSKAHDYEIRLKGHLDVRWGDRFEDMTITLEDNGDTLLTGPVMDQAALHGLLKNVRDFGLSLLSVNRVPPMESTNQSTRERKMNTSHKLVQVQDRKVILSTLWIILMFCIAYADIIGFIEPGMLEKIIYGDMGIEITSPMIVVVSLVQALPIGMIGVSRLIRRGLNRWMNVAAAGLTLVYVLGGGNWESVSYPIFAALEVIALLGIIWLAWTWRKDEA